MTDDLIVRSHGRVGHISLNRPKAIHALNTEMCRGISAALEDWRADQGVEAVLLDHSEGRGFCAGGDIRMIAESGAEDGVKAREFFREEYRMNNALFGYAKPIVAFMDGVTMGGGVGISLPCEYRVATENTRFAMPETGIGLFPDVGGGWYLSRLPGRVGQFLALTGARLDGGECVELGIATHYLPSEHLEEAKERIAADPGRIKGILGQLAASPPEARILANLDKINKLFASDDLTEIMDALGNDESEWAQRELDTLCTKSPLSCKVSLRLLREGATMPFFMDEMRQEFAVASHIVQRHDFIEGVRALIIDKDNRPEWDPAHPDEVTAHMIDTIFAPLSDDEAWTPE
jgi:enoyl-CoA hydratase